MIIKLREGFPDMRPVITTLGDSPKMQLFVLSREAMPKAYLVTTPRLRKPLLEALAKR